MGNLQQANENFRRATDIRLKKLPPEPIGVKSTKNILGATQTALEDRQEAKESDERSSDIRLEKLGETYLQRLRFCTGFLGRLAAG